jgi:acetylornithine deacetylase
VVVVNQAVERLNTKSALSRLEERVRNFRGRDSKFTLNRDQPEEQPGHLEIKWLSEPIQGLACHLDSAGYRALAAATEKVIGHVAPLADTGSLPLVADLQEAGFDVQTVGYGLEDAYHADDEYALLSDFQQGFRVLANVIEQLAPKQ